MEELRDMLRVMQSEMLTHHDELLRALRTLEMRVLRLEMSVQTTIVQATNMQHQLQRLIELETVDG